MFLPAANLAFLDKESEETVFLFIAKKCMAGTVTPVWQIILEPGSVPITSKICPEVRELIAFFVLSSGIGQLNPLVSRT